MSWRKRLGQLVAEFGEDVVQQASRVLASDATEAQARKTLERVMRTVPEGVDFAVPRRRVKPKVRTDNPGGDWLKHTRRRAEENYSVDNRVTGPVTGYLKRQIELDPQKLAAIPGARGERRVPGEAQYDRLRPSVEEHGLYPDNPILVGINHLGDPYIIEGNTRAAVARDLGLRSVPAEVRWFAGGEGVAGPMMPELLEKYMPPSELMLDPRFSRWFGNSELVDGFGEPSMFYHGTGNAFSRFEGDRRDRQGFYFTDSPAYARDYAEDAADGISYYPDEVAQGPNIMPVYLSAQNPLWVQEGWPAHVTRELPSDLASYLKGLHPAEYWMGMDASEGRRLVPILKNMGYDGLVGREEGNNVYTVFEPTQIKSATGNRGTYDPNDPDIRKARGGLAVKRKKGKR